MHISLQLISHRVVTGGADKRKETGMTETGTEGEGKSATWKRRYRFPWNLIPVLRHLFHLSLKSVTTIFTIFRRCINHAENTRGSSASWRPFSIEHGSRLRNLLSYIIRKRVCVRVCLPVNAEKYPTPRGFSVVSSIDVIRHRHEIVDRRCR